MVAAGGEAEGVATVANQQLHRKVGRPVAAWRRRVRAEVRRVAHYSKLSAIVIDVPAADHDREVAFWQVAAGAELNAGERYPEFHGGKLPGDDASLLVQRLEAGPARVHLDIHTDDLDAEVARLERAGAQRAGEVNGWWIMQDPAGLPFCVIPEKPGNLTDGNARRWG
jgi:hypothetical protein